MENSKKMKNLIKNELSKNSYMVGDIAIFGNPYRYAEAEEQMKELEKHGNFTNRINSSPNYSKGL